MTALLVGYARVSTDGQDLTAQRDGLRARGAPEARVYVDHGLTGTNRDRPGLRETMAACREGDTLVVTKLDRLARSLPDTRRILEELTARQVRASVSGTLTGWRSSPVTRRAGQAQQNTCTPSRRWSPERQRHAPYVRPATSVVVAAVTPGTSRAPETVAHH